MRGPTRTSSGAGARAARGTVLIGILLAAPGCARAADDTTTPDFVTGIVLQDDAGKETRQFLGRGPAILVVTIRNRGAATRTLVLPTSQTHDCIVYAGNDRREVWRWSAGRMFAQVVTELTFGPGESRAFTVRWDLTDRTGAPLPPGEYRVVGVVPARVEGARSGPQVLEILPPRAGS